MTQRDTDKYKIPIPIKKIDSQDKHICHKIDVSDYTPDTTKLDELVNAIGNAAAEDARAADPTITAAAANDANNDAVRDARNNINNYSLNENVYIIIDVDKPNDYKPIDKLKNITLYKDHDGNKISTVYKKPSENNDEDNNIAESESDIDNIISNLEESYSENKTMEEVTLNAEEAAEKAIIEANPPNENQDQTKKSMEEAMRAAKIAYFGIDPKVVQVGGNAETSQDALDKVATEFLKVGFRSISESTREPRTPINYNRVMRLDPFRNIRIGNNRNEYNIIPENNTELEENIVNLKNTAKTISEEREKALKLAREIDEEEFAAKAADISARSSELIGKMISLNERQMAINDISGNKLYDRAAAAGTTEEQEAQYELRQSLENAENYFNTGYTDRDEAEQGLSNQIEANAEEADKFNYTEFEDTIKNNKEDAYKEEQKIGISKFYDDELAKLENEHHETLNKKDNETNAAVQQQKKLSKMIGAKPNDKKEEAHEATEKAMTEINTHRDIGVKKIEAEIEAALANKDKMEYEKTKYEKNEYMEVDLKKLKNLTNCGSEFTKIYDKVYSSAKLANEVLIKISNGTADDGFINSSITQIINDHTASVRADGGTFPHLNIDEDTVKNIIKQESADFTYVTKSNLDDIPYADTIIESTIDKACKKTVAAYKNYINSDATDPAEAATVAAAAATRAVEVEAEAEDAARRAAETEEADNAAAADAATRAAENADDTADHAAADVYAAATAAVNAAALTVGEEGHIVIPSNVNDSGFNRIVILRDIIKKAAVHFIKEYTRFTEDNINSILNDNDNKNMIDNALKIAFAHAEGDGGERVVAIGYTRLVAAGDPTADNLLTPNGSLDNKIKATSKTAIAILLKLLVDSTGNSSSNLNNYNKNIDNANEEYVKLIKNLKDNAEETIKSYHDIHGEGKLVMYVIDPFDLLKDKNNLCAEGKQKGTYDKDGHFHHIFKNNMFGMNATSLQSGGGISNSFNIQTDKFLQSLFKKITQ